MYLSVHNAEVMTVCPTAGFKCKPLDGFQWQYCVSTLQIRRSKLNVVRIFRPILSSNVCNNKLRLSQEEEKKKEDQNKSIPK
jgi:hypothetical protein